MRPATVVLVLTSVAAVPACSLFTSLGDFATDGPPAEMVVDAGVHPDGVTLADASRAAPSSEAGPRGPVDAGEDSAAAAQNLHPQGSFEVGCSPWDGYQATATSSTTARSGARSCRVCVMQGVADFFTLDDNTIPLSPVAGARYRAEAWVRAAPGSVSPTTAQIYLRTVTPAPFVTHQQAEGPFIVLPANGEWVRLQIELTANQAQGVFNVFVAAPAVPGACFLVDDVRLERLD